MKSKFVALTFSLLCIVLAACGGQPEPKSIAPADFAVSDRFAAYYEAHGGRITLGDPISGEVADKGLVYQYFQNGRLEYNSGAAPGLEISLSPLGLEFGENEDSGTPTSVGGALCYMETGHCITAFREYFEAYGGVFFFGYPISDLHFDGQRAVQYFERGGLVWDPALPSGDRVQMSPFGLLKCAETNCHAPPALPLPPPAQGDMPTATPVTPPFAEFVANHGGADVFGEPLTLPGPGPDGALEQYYTNAVLYVDPAAPDTVRLRNLGADWHTADAPADEVHDPDGYYDPVTGHNVLYDFQQFYEMVGGTAVLGRPISEMMLEDGVGVQYFENGRMEYHGHEAPDERISLSPLGREALASAEPTEAPPALPAQHLVIQTWADSPILAIGHLQTIFVRLSDDHGNPLEGVTVRVTVDTTGMPVDYGLPPTDAEGQTSVDFYLQEWRPGEMVLYNVTAETPGMDAVQVQDQFIQWHGSLPTATPGT
jgi:hypothetical protein